MADSSYEEISVKTTNGSVTIKNQPPIASFTFSHENPVVNETITFNTSDSYDPDGFIVKYEWDFGDGNITNTTDDIITHIYFLAEDYNVTLTVTDNYGATNSTNRTITVYLPKTIFDTDSGTYPPIFGIHNGTIKPNQTITVHKLYTYPCIGTGRHTEYVRIWGNGIDMNTTWGGYSGDWHNITFDSFTLEAGKTYNYTIRTGSYPQIHHLDALPTVNGWINCTEFVGVNDKIYNNWIPAIKLW